MTDVQRVTTKHGTTWGVRLPCPNDDERHAGRADASCRVELEWDAGEPETWGADGGDPAVWPHFAVCELTPCPVCQYPLGTAEMGTVKRRAIEAVCAQEDNADAR